MEPTSLDTNVAALRSIVAHVDVVLENVHKFGDEWTPSVVRLLQPFDDYYSRLIEGQPDDATFSTAAQFLFEQAVEKLISSLEECAGAHRLMHSSISRAGKDVAAKFTNSIDGLVKNERCLEGGDPQAAAATLELVYDHFMSLGLVDVAETLLEETKQSDYLIPVDSTARLEESELLRDQIRTVLSAMDQRDVGPAVDWLDVEESSASSSSADHQNPMKTRQKSYASDDDGSSSPPAVDKSSNRLARLADVKFRLLQLHMFLLLDSGDRNGALLFSRRLAAFGNLLGYAARIGRLMGAIVFYAKQPEKYEDLHDEKAWKSVRADLARLMYRKPSHLDDFVQTGAQMLPTLLNLKGVMTSRQENVFVGSDELPTPTPNVGSITPAHSTFCCPILKQQATETNPPMRLACGHVISLEALQRLAQAARFRMKCPYCPSQSTQGEAREIHF